MEKHFPMHRWLSSGGSNSTSNDGDGEGYSRVDSRGIGGYGGGGGGGRFLWIDGYEDEELT